MMQHMDQPLFTLGHYAANANVLNVHGSYYFEREKTCIGCMLVGMVRVIYDSELIRYLTYQCRQPGHQSQRLQLPVSDVWVPSGQDSVAPASI